VATNASISWQTGLWYWMTGTGNAGTTSHNAMVNGASADKSSVRLSVRMAG
jgi:hypothetical protein